MLAISKNGKDRNGIFSLFTAVSVLISSLVLLLPILGIAQSPDWIWASSAGGYSGDYGYSICTDNNGNTYTTGYFTESITFGNITLNDEGSSDIFLVKYNSLGNVLWAKSFGGTGLDYANKVTLDINGNIFLTGAFRSDSIAFGNIYLSNPNFNPAYDAFFLVNIDPDGDVLWASTSNSDGNCWGKFVDVDDDGSIYVTGSFDGVATTFGDVTLTNSYQFFSDIFIVKYSDSGNVLWAKSFGGTSYDYGSSIVSDNNGNVYLIGSFESNSISFDNLSLYNSGGIDSFILQLDTLGNILWVRQVSGDRDDIYTNIAINEFGNVFVSGYYSSETISFGEGITWSGNDGSDNIMILSYDIFGNIGWAQSTLGSENDEAYGISIDDNNNIFVVGEFESSPLTFAGQISINNSSIGYTDMFVFKIDPNGSGVWAKSAGGNDDDFAVGISTSSNGNAYITGGFYSTSILFGSTYLVNANNTSNSSDYFIAKLNSLTGINESLLKDNKLVYPNPAGNTVQIETKSNANIEIYSLSGQLVLQSSILGNNNLVNISTLSPGLYCVKVISKEGISIDKLVKE